MIEQLRLAAGRDVSRETFEKLEAFADLLIAENEKQNLISKSSEADLWQRHILDSAQLLRFAPADARWLDIGSGPGLPGLVLATLGVTSITMVEPRRLRTDFLHRFAAELVLDNVTVVTGKAEHLTGTFDVITARAVAPLDRLFAMGEHLLSQNGQWVLPKGRSAAKELEEARSTWQGEFRLEASQTDAHAQILVAREVRRKRKAGRG